MVASGEWVQPRAVQAHWACGALIGIEQEEPWTLIGQSLLVRKLILFR